MVKMQVVQMAHCHTIDIRCENIHAMMHALRITMKPPHDAVIAPSRLNRLLVDSTIPSQQGCLASSALATVWQTSLCYKKIYGNKFRPDFESVPVQ